MYRVSIKVFLAYVSFSLLYFNLCFILAYYYHPGENIGGYFNRLFFWIDGYAIYFMTLLMTSFAGAVCSHLQQAKRAFWAFLTVFIGTALFIAYATIAGA